MPNVPEKPRNVWCAKDNGMVGRHWMILGAPPTRIVPLLADEGVCPRVQLQPGAALRRVRPPGTEEAPTFVRCPAMCGNAHTGFPADL